MGFSFIGETIMPEVVSYDEAFEASKEYFGGDKLAANIFLSKYALQDQQGNLLEKTPTDMHWRIASELARIEKKKFKTPMTKEEIFEHINHFKRIFAPAPFTPS